jgi:hypothetical protein
MYDLDGTEDEDAVDITPDFMKHDDPEVEAPEAAADPAADPGADDQDAEKDKD